MKVSKSNLLKTSCILCGCEDIHLKYIVKGFHIVRCRRCSLFFVADRLNKEQIGEYSKNELAGEWEYTYVDQNNTENLNFYYNNLAAIINKRRPKGRVLDVGCSAGYFLDRMQGWECYGIEPIIFQGEKAKQGYGENIHIGTLEDCSYPTGYFDVITLQDSLDHMPDPLWAIKKCHILLQADGLLVVKVHDISCLYAKITGPRFYALIPPFHLCYFNRDNLFKLLELAGFKIEEYKYMDQMLFLKTILFRLSQSNNKSIFYYLFTLLNALPFRDLKVKKNLHDIITVFASKKSPLER